MHARLWFAVVNVDIAQSSRHTRNAITREVCYQIDASGSDKARVAVALVNLKAAVFALVPRWTNALIVVHLR